MVQTESQAPDATETLHNNNNNNNEGNNNNSNHDNNKYWGKALCNREGGSVRPRAAQDEVWALMSPVKSCVLIMVQWRLPTTILTPQAPSHINGLSQPCLQLQRLRHALHLSHHVSRCNGAIAAAATVALTASSFTCHCCCKRINSAMSVATFTKASIASVFDSTASQP